MPTTSPTATAILDAARRRFNERGYAASTLTEIASDVGISQGNLTYHFPTKRDLMTRMQEGVAELIAEHRARRSGNAVEDQYLARLGLVLELFSTYRFLMRDDAQIEPGPDHQTPHKVLVDDFAALRDLVEALDDEGLVRRDIDVDRAMLTRSLYVLGRHWMDHLAEMELVEELTPDRMADAVEHHLAVLRPNLTAAGRSRVDAARNRYLAVD